MKTTNTEILKRHFDFLRSISAFELKEIRSQKSALYAKFLSHSVGLYFIYEFRDAIPQIQFTLLKTDELEVRPGIYTIKALYKEQSYKLKSFYLDEIILVKTGKEYRDYFKDAKTVEEAIKISIALIEQYAKDFLIGDKKSYAGMDIWFRAQLIEV